MPDPLGGGGSTGRVTAAQRLRLVLALGLVNIILASVALSVGFVGLQSPPTTAGGPTPGIAFASPLPTTTAAPEPTPASSPEPGTSTPGTPDADQRTGPRADADRPDELARRRADADRRAVAGRRAVAAPSAPAQTAAPAATRTPVRVPPVAVAQPNAPAPTRRPGPGHARTGQGAGRVSGQEGGQDR